LGAGRSPGSSGDRSSNIRPAINDGQWHSFGNAGSSARSNAGRNSGSSANSSLSARNAGSVEGGWHSFGPSRGAPSFGGGPLRGAPGFGRGGDGWRGGWRGNDWDRGWGWGGWGFGVGWPFWGFYWGPAWAFGWDPWWYGSYGYGPWPAYSYYHYPDYSYDWSDNPPPYRPDSSPNLSYDRDPSANSLDPINSDHSFNHSSNYEDNHFNLNPGSSSDNSGSVQNGETPQPEAVPNSPAPATQSPGTAGII
jgi:hypothetical protein